MSALMEPIWGHPSWGCSSVAATSNDVPDLSGAGNSADDSEMTKTVAEATRPAGHDVTASDLDDMD